MWCSPHSTAVRPPHKGLVWFGKAQLNASFGPRLVCGDTKLLRAAPARRPSGSAGPGTWPHFPICVGWNHGWESQPTIGLESAVCPFWVTPLGPRPHGPSGIAPGWRPRPAGPGSLELPLHPRFMWIEPHTSKEAAKGPLMVSGGGARPIARLWLRCRHLGPSTTGPKKAGRGFSGTLHTWGAYPDRP